MEQKPLNRLDSDTYFATIFRLVVIQSSSGLKALQ